MTIELDKTKNYFFYNTCSPLDNVDLLNSLEEQDNVISVEIGPADWELFNDYVESMGNVEIAAFPSLVYWKPTRSHYVVTGITTDVSQALTEEISWEEVGEDVGPNDGLTYYVSEYGVEYYGGPVWQENGGGWVSSTFYKDDDERPYTWEKLWGKKTEDLTVYPTNYRLFRLDVKNPPENLTEHTP